MSGSNTYISPHSSNTFHQKNVPTEESSDSGIAKDTLQCGPPPYTISPSAPTALPQSDGNAYVGNQHIAQNIVGPDASKAVAFEKSPVHTQCRHCSRMITTSVVDKVNSRGIAWAVACCCFGSFLLSYMVLCMDCFREWYHNCPLCKTVVARYKPTASAGFVIGLIFLSVCVAAIQALALYYYFVLLPQEGSKDAYYG